MATKLLLKRLIAPFYTVLTRNSILTIAKDLGMTVSERNFSVTELLERAAKPGTEAALSGTAAVLTAVGTFIHNDKEYKVGTGEPGPTTARLRQALNDIQWGKSEDKHGWLTKI